jgi:thiol-disulfide isomerase/thioredoxin
MKLIKYYIIFLLCLNASGPLLAQAVNDSLFNGAVVNKFRLIDAGNGKTRPLNEITASQNLLLFVFLSPECPLCKNYAPVLDSLQRLYNGSLRLIGIVPGKTYSTTVIRAYASKYKIHFPLLIDPVKKLSGYLHAVATPEVILLTPQYELVYRGGIDNRVKQLGVKSWKATENYLSDAVSQYLQHTAVAVKRTKPIGCRINDF